MKKVFYTISEQVMPAGRNRSDQIHLLCRLLQLRNKKTEKSYVEYHVLRNESGIMKIYG